MRLAIAYETKAAPPAHLSCALQPNLFDLVLLHLGKESEPLGIADVLRLEFTGRVCLGIATNSRYGIEQEESANVLVIYRVALVVINVHLHCGESHYQFLQTVGWCNFLTLSSPELASM